MPAVVFGIEHFSLYGNYRCDGGGGAALRQKICKVREGKDHCFEGFGSSFVRSDYNEQALSGLQIRHGKMGANYP